MEGRIHLRPCKERSNQREEPDRRSEKRIVKKSRRRGEVYDSVIGWRNHP